MTDHPPAKQPAPRRRRVVTLALAGAALALVATLGLGNLMSATAQQCDAQPERAARIDAAAIGALAALNGTGEGRGFADLPFIDAEGQPVTIADFSGKTLLVNFWASWCVPCRAEMPALDSLAQQFNSDDFMVLPINLDLSAEGLEEARAFLAEENITHLPLYADPTFDAFKRLQTEAVAIGLPATLLLDEAGCELGVLQGPAEWDSPDGHNVVAALRS